MNWCQIFYLATIEQIRIVSSILATRTFSWIKWKSVRMFAAAWIGFADCTSQHDWFIICTDTLNWNMLQNHLFWDYPFLPRNQVLSGNTWYCISLLWHFEPHLWHILDHIRMMISCNRIPCCSDAHMSTLVLCWKRFWTFSGDQKLSRIYTINNVIHIDVGDTDFSATIRRLSSSKSMR